MIKIGKYNTLKVIRFLEIGLQLEGGDHGPILLPSNAVPEGVKLEDELDVFIYTDSEDRIIATTETPYAQVGDFALLKVVDVNNTGAILDWGLRKDLLVPFGEQKQKMEVGRSYIVYIYLDYSTQRIAATAKLNKQLDELEPEYTTNEEVDLLIHSKTDLGYKAIVNKKHWGMLYKDEVFQDLQPGQKVKGYIKKLREDKKIDLSLSKQGYEQIEPLAKSIYTQLEKAGGFLPVNDKSKPEAIYDMFSISKKNFKKAVGNLYKNRMIVIEKDGIRINPSD